MDYQARVVIIGGGIYGVSIAYHLAKNGWNDLILIEKNDISSGTTAHAAGLVTQFATSETLMQFRKYSIDLYSDLGLIEHVGSLRVASSPEQFKELQRSVSRAKGIGMEVEIISPSDAKEIMPQISEEELYGAIYLPRDGHLDPYTTTTSIAKLVREMGGKLITGTLMIGIELSPKDEIQRVITDQGSITAEHVIIAAGIWSPRVAALAGVNIPSTPVDHQHIALKAVPGNEFAHSTPCLRDPDNLDFRPRQGSELVDAGSTEVGMKLDYLGKAPDIGPYEYGAKDYRIPGRQVDRASRPIPPNCSTTVKADADLMWLGGRKAVRHRIHVGVGGADLTFRREQKNNIFDPGPLEPGASYRWRIDTVTNEGVLKGDVWVFTVSDDPPTP